MNIPLNIDFLQVLLHMLNFVILFGGLSLLFFNPICKFLNARAEMFASQEQKNREDAETNERLRAEYEEKMRSADHEIEELKKVAERETAERTAQHISDATARASAIIAEAEAEAEEHKGHILESAQAEIVELVVNATQRLLSDTVTPERNSALYDEFIRLAEANARGEGTEDEK